MPAPVQITAEQLLREAKERELELVPPVSEINYSISKCHILCYLKFIAYKHYIFKYSYFLSFSFSAS